MSRVRPSEWTEFGEVGSVVREFARFLAKGARSIRDLAKPPSNEIGSIGL